jgi:5-methyltetrahydrofolate--homocysteine methyltransferase
MRRSLIDAMHSGRVMLMDGAMGTELQRMASRMSHPPTDWNLDRPDAVRSIHQSYADAGAEVLITNTFQLNPLARRDRPIQSLEESFQAAVAIARGVARRSRYVLIDAGPIMSAGNVEFGDLAALDRVVEWARSAPADGILFETCSSARVRFAVERAKSLGIPILLSLTYRRNAKGRIETYDGHSPEWFAKRARKWGLEALGVNCGLEISVADCAAIVREYRNATDLPIFARPNAGTPKRIGRRWSYPRTSEAMAADLHLILDAGATMIGGCCGTAPAYIRAFRRALKKQVTPSLRFRSDRH